MINLTAVKVLKESKKVILEFSNGEECEISPTEARAIAHSYKTLYMEEKKECKPCNQSDWKPSKPLTDLENH